MAPSNDPTLSKTLDYWKNKLIDLSKRNRLINFKQTKTSTIQLTEPSIDAIYTRLVKQQKPVTFYIPDEEQQDTEDADEAPSEDESEERRELKQGEVLGEVTGSKPDRVLKNSRLRSRTALQETGTNILFAAFGLLEWTESEDSDTPLYSPLILVPVTISRESVFEPYTMELFDDDIVVNPALMQKLTEFGIELPELHDMSDVENLNAVLTELQETLSQKPEWVIREEAYVSFFSFSKLAMYKDLEEYESHFSGHPIIQALAGDTTSLPEPREEIPLPDELDDQVHPTEMYQVLDADSSQQEAIIAAKKGASFVLQGPPGTGKSQTIANIIAEALAEDKTVLFVSEKMAALDVVKERLDQNGLGEFCLEAHSEKAHKQSIIQELYRTYESPPASAHDVDVDDLQRLAEVRRDLNAYIRALNQKWSALNKTPYQIHGKLAELAEAPDITFELPQVLEIDQRHLDDTLGLIQRITALPHIYRDPTSHPWHGFRINRYGFQLRSEIDDHFRTFSGLLDKVEDTGQQIAQELGIRAPATLEEFLRLQQTLKVHTPDVLSLQLGTLNQRLPQYDSIIHRTLYFFNYWQDMRAIRDTMRDPESFTVEKAKHSLWTAYQVRSRLGQPKNPQAQYSDTFREARDMLHEYITNIKEELDYINDLYPIKEKPMYGQNPMHLSCQAIREWLTDKLEQLDSLQEWVEYHTALHALQEAGFGPFIQKAHERDIAAEKLTAAFQKHLYKKWLDAVYEQSTVLQNFNSHEYAQLMERFRRLDRQQLDLAKKRIRHKLTQKRPQFFFSDAPSSEQTILRREARKKRKHKPIRRLFGEIPDLLTTLKPCLMMSPLSISHFLKPDVKQFDLVVFDEASQVLPEDAIGAIARAKQAIVVGDDQQLPPTQFFANVQSDEFTEEEIAEHSAFDSILEECSAAGLSERMLRWHYRSEDESLIAFSNHHFYDNRLNTFPRAKLDGDHIGVSFVHVPNGIYDRGKSRQNTQEAETVADLVMDHFQQTPHLSLGVVAFSEAQQMAILDALEARRRENPDMEPYFDDANDEAFFVKNLESVQGDERDVMYFSVGYGYDAAGKFSHAFGPLTAEGGHRRLNVAVTRARRHIKLIASIESSDIDLGRTNSYGARLLKNYLEYAERHGDISVLHGETSVSPGEDFDSPFEKEVFYALQAQGYVVHNQVGCSDYRIDLAVVDPEQPGRFLLGIECDGATYHSSKTARDRDRLRQQILEDKFGWRIHRIWSRDWAENPHQELEKLESVIKEAQHAPPPEQDTADNGAPVSETQSGEGQDMPDTEGPEGADAAANTLPPGVDVYEPIDPHSIPSPGDPTSDIAIGRAVDRIVRKEGPIHYMDAARRVAEFQGAAHPGARIQRATQQAAISAGHSMHNDFIWPAGMETPPVRIPKATDSPRDIDQIAIEEIAEAAKLCITNAFSLTRDDAVTQTARLLGFSRTGEKIQKRIEDALDQLLADGQIVYEGDQLKPHA